MICWLLNHQVVAQRHRARYEIGAAAALPASDTRHKPTAPKKPLVAFEDDVNGGHPIECTVFAKWDFVTTIAWVMVTKSYIVGSPVD
jgi:hypothetical protein